MVVHVCTDGKTKLLVYCSCHDNNKAETVLTFSKEGSGKWGNSFSSKKLLWNGKLSSGGIS